MTFSVTNRRVLCRERQTFGQRSENVHVLIRPLPTRDPVERRPIRSSPHAISLHGSQITSSVTCLFGLVKKGHCNCDSPRAAATRWFLLPQQCAVRDGLQLFHVSRDTKQFVETLNHGQNVHHGSDNTSSSVPASPNHMYCYTHHLLTNVHDPVIPRDEGSKRGENGQHCSTPRVNAHMPWNTCQLSHTYHGERNHHQNNNSQDYDCNELPKFLSRIPAVMLDVLHDSRGRLLSLSLSLCGRRVCCCV